MFKGSENIDFTSNSRAVYGIRNIVSGKTYVGSTQFLEKRVVAHYNRLLSKTHYNSELQSDFTEKGKDLFELILFKSFQNSTRQQVSDYEKELINKLTNVYNKNSREDKRQFAVNKIGRSVLNKSEIELILKNVILFRNKTTACAFANIAPLSLDKALKGNPIKTSQKILLLDFCKQVSK